MHSENKYHFFKIMGWLFNFVYVDDADRTLKKAIENGATVINGVAD